MLETGSQTKAYAQVVLIFGPNLKLAVLIEQVFIKSVYSTCKTVKMKTKSEGKFEEWNFHAPGGYRLINFTYNFGTLYSLHPVGTGKIIKQSERGY